MPCHLEDIVYASAGTLHEGFEEQVAQITPSQAERHAAAAALSPRLPFAAGAAVLRCMTSPLCFGLSHACPCSRRQTCWAS